MVLALYLPFFFHLLDLRELQINRGEGLHTVLPIYGSDSIGYGLLADNLLQNGSLAYGGDYLHKPDTFRTPGFPAVLAVFKAVSGSYKYFPLLQILFVVGTAFLIYKIGRKTSFPSLFYTIFLPLTIYPVFAAFKLLNFQTSISGSSLIVNAQPLAFISACIAPYAYYLILALIMLTKEIKPMTRFKMFLLASILILLANILRIIILTLVLLYHGNNEFELIHISFWYFVSTIYVVLVWILLTKIFKITSIPIYSDFKYLLENSMFKKKVLNKHK